METYLVSDIRSHFSPISVHLLEESQVIVAVQELIIALFRLDRFQAGVLQYNDDTLLRVLLVVLLEAILLSLLR